MCVRDTAAWGGWTRGHVDKVAHSLNQCVEDAVAAGTLAPHARPRRPVCGADIALYGGPARLQLAPEAGPEDLLDIVEAVLTESEAKRAAGGGECRGCEQHRGMA